MLRLDPGRSDDSLARGSVMIIRRAVTAAALLLAVVAISIVLLSSGSSYDLKLTFSDASQLVTGNQVKVGGVPIGTVSTIGLTPSGQALITVSISSSQFIPLHQGTTAAVRIS